MSDSLFFDEDEFELDGPSEDEESLFLGGGKYTYKVQAPRYIPKGPCPALSECYDVKPYEEAVKKINDSDLSDDVKSFLRLAAARLIVFDFSKIANYYAFADKETQELMEDLALVIIDFNDALQKGFVKLDKRIDGFIDKHIEDLGRGY